jgi:hypothetical protein
MTDSTRALLLAAADDDGHPDRGGHEGGKNAYSDWPIHA